MPIDSHGDYAKKRNRIEFARKADSGYAFCMKSEKLLTYTAVFEPAEEGGFVVSVPMLPGCLTQGETFEEAKRNIEEAITLYLEVLKEVGDEIPHEVERPIIASVMAPDPA